MANENEKRIVQLTAMTTDEIDTIMGSSDEAKKWYLPVDYDKTVAGTESEEGTKRIPFNRVAMLDEDNGVVPARMLPSYVDEIVCGSMNSDGTEFTDDITGNVYAAPYQDGKMPPTAHHIYRDDETDLQYRWGGTEHDEFIVIPQSLAMVAGHGIQLTQTATTNTIAVKPAVYYHSDEYMGSTSYALSTKIFDTTSDARTTDESGNPVISVTSTSGTGMTINGLNGGCYYIVRGQLKFTVSGTLSPNVTTVYVKFGNNATKSKKAYAQLDLSFASVPQFLNFDFGYMLDANETSLAISVECDETLPTGLTVNVSRVGFYVTEIN